MKIVHQKAELLQQEPGLEGIYKQIEQAGRICYKSENKITEDSAKGFVDRMIQNHHNAMLEHGTVYLKYSTPLVRGVQECQEILGKYKDNSYSKYVQLQTKTEHGADAIAYVTTNLRVLIENGWMDDLKYLCEPDTNHEKRIAFKLITDRGVWNEVIRNRTIDRDDYPKFEQIASFAQESTRYCNYSKDKFDNQLTFICPSWLNLNDGQYDVINFNIVGDGYIKDYGDESSENLFLMHCLGTEEIYKQLLKNGQTPQQARQVLNQATKTEMIVTAFESDWRHFFDLRYFGTTGKPHPDMLELTGLMKEELEKYDLWKLIKGDENVEG